MTTLIAILAILAAISLVVVLVVEHRDGYPLREDR